MVEGGALDPVACGNKIRRATVEADEADPEGHDQTGDQRQRWGKSVQKGQSGLSETAFYSL